MVIVSPPTPAGLVDNFISLATALGASFTDQEYKARESIWVGRKQRTGVGGEKDKPPAASTAVEDAFGFKCLAKAGLSSATCMKVS